MKTAWSRFKCLADTLRGSKNDLIGEYKDADVHDFRTNDDRDNYVAYIRSVGRLCYGGNRFDESLTECAPS